MREIRRFRAYGEDGAEYTVVERRSVSTFSPLSSGAQQYLGAADFVLSDGRGVNQLDDPKAFQILDTDEIIRER